MLVNKLKEKTYMAWGITQGWNFIQENLISVAEDGHMDCIIKVKYNRLNKDYRVENDNELVVHFQTGMDGQAVAETFVEYLNNEGVSASLQQDQNGLEIYCNWL